MILVALYLLLPSACWWLAARTRSVRLRIGAWLAVIAVLQVMLLTGLLLPSRRVTFGVVLAMTAIVQLIRGLRRESGVRASAWRTVGRVLTIVYCVVAGLAVAATALLFAIDGKRAEMPSDREVLPLPSGLTVTADQDEGCGDGSFCSRDITVVGAPGVPPAEVERLLEADFSVRYGWRFVPDPTGFGGRRTKGWPLDHVIEYVYVTVGDRSRCRW